MHTFAFVIHPLGKGDVARKYGLARYLPTRVVEWAVARLRPYLLSHIRGVKSKTGAEVEGLFVACPLLPRHFTALPAEQVVARIVEAGRVAQEAGAEILGLGALTSVVGDAGISVARGLSIPVTTGNSYTVATAVEATCLAAKKMGIEVSEARAAVVGATGSIGQVCAEMLAEQAKTVLLVGRNRDRLQALAERVSALPGTRASLEVSTDLGQVLPTAHLVVSVSSAVDAIIRPQNLMSGAVVCDVARPRDVSPQVAKQRDDVLVIEGGVVDVPGEVDFGFDFGFPPRTAYACMAETMLLALEGRLESFSLGRELQRSKVDEMVALANKHGFRLAGFRSFERAVEEEEIEAIRRRARRAAPAAA